MGYWGFWTKPRETHQQIGVVISINQYTEMG